MKSDHYGTPGDHSLADLRAALNGADGDHTHLYLYMKRGTFSSEFMDQIAPIIRECGRRITLLHVAYLDNEEVEAILCRLAGGLQSLETLRMRTGGVSTELSEFIQQSPSLANLHIGPGVVIENLSPIVAAVKGHCNLTCLEVCLGHCARVYHNLGEIIRHCTLRELIINSHGGHAVQRLEVHAHLIQEALRSNETISSVTLKTDDFHFQTCLVNVLSAATFDNSSLNRICSSNHSLTTLEHRVALPLRGATASTHQVRFYRRNIIINALPCSRWSKVKAKILTNEGEAENRQVGLLYRCMWEVADKGRRYLYHYIMAWLANDNRDMSIEALALQMSFVALIFK